MRLVVCRNSQSFTLALNEYDVFDNNQKRRHVMKNPGGIGNLQEPVN